MDWQSLLKPKKTIQIAVSGGVHVTALELRIIDTADFQRLRRIRQLGTACIVYPTALHTRFDHSLGTLHMAQRMVDAIRGNSHSLPKERHIPLQDEVLVRLYALLHDVPHIPFGHSLEDELGVFERHDKNPARLARFLGPESEIGQIIVEELGQAFLTRLMGIYCWDEKTSADSVEPQDVYIYDIVSNTACADLLDYIQRDDYFCNLGIQLEYHFLKYLHAPTDPSTGRRRVAIKLSKTNNEPRRDILSDLSRLLEARYLLAERVYFHHAKLITAAMLGRALQEALLCKELSESDLYDHSDETLLYSLRKSKSEIAQRLASGLIERRLYKRASQITQRHFEVVCHRDQGRQPIEVAMQKVGEDAARRRELENDWAEMIAVEPGEVLIYAPSRNMNRKAAQMQVLWEGRYKPLSEIYDPVITPKLEATVAGHEYLWAINILVAPGVPLEKRYLLGEIAETEFVRPVEEVEYKTRKLYKDILEQEFKRRKVGEMEPSLFEEKLEAAVGDLMVQQHGGKKSFKERKEGVIRKHFS